MGSSTGGVLSPLGASVESLFNRSARALTNLLTQSKGSTTPASGSASEPSDSFGPDQAGEIAEQFEGFVYRSLVEKLSFSYNSKQAASSGDEGAASSAASANQLTFEFYAESREIEVARFSQRIQNAAENLDGARGNRLVEAGRLTAQRFSLSVSISGAALNGFATGAEQSVNADEAFDSFLAFADDALSKADEVLNKLLELLDGFFKGEGDFETRFNNLLKGLQEGGLLDNPLFASPAANGGGTTVQAAGFQIQLEFEFTSVEVTQGKVQESDPIVFDLDGDGIELTNYRNGANFDLLGSGAAVRTGFVNGGDAFLALDRNGNGTIDDGTELFGDQRGAAHGFEELRKLDSNNDGRIDRNDEKYGDLRLWRDDGDGSTEEGELISLKDAGVSTIDLGYTNINEKTSGGNRLTQTAKFYYEDGRNGRVANALLNYLA
ncbi:MAG: hypothetical protein AMXMBFR84_01230 [Candidatus Hydrogenedentota bacterium]